MTRQVRLTAEQYDEWQAKVKAQKDNIACLRKRSAPGVIPEVGEPRTRDAVRRNRSTEGQGNVKSGDRTQHATIGAGSSSAHAPYKSKLEARYAAHLDLLQKAGEIRRWMYEPMSLKLSQGKRYRYDFLVILPLGREAKPEAHEIKGKWTKNKRDGMTHLKWAAQLYGDVFTFRLIEWNGHGFDGSYVVV